MCNNASKKGKLLTKRGLFNAYVPMIRPRYRVVIINLCMGMKRLNFESCVHASKMLRVRKSACARRNQSPSYASFMLHADGSKFSDGVDVRSF